jgi:hypothetical protein
MSADRPPTLAEVLTDPTHSGTNVLLFLPPDQVWTAGTPALVVDLDATGEEPEEVERRTGYQYALGLPTVEDIVTNARLQQPGASAADLVGAFLHYYDNDAFIDFDRTPS